MFSILVFELTMQKKVATRAWSQLSHSSLDGRFIISLDRKRVTRVGPVEERCVPSPQRGALAHLVKSRRQEGGAGWWTLGFRPHRPLKGKQGL